MLQNLLIPVGEMQTPQQIKGSDSLEKQAYVQKPGKSGQNSVSGFSHNVEIVLRLKINCEDSKFRMV